MARTRKYTDEQRQAFYELHLDGLDSNEIAAKCRAGDAGLLMPFDPPPRSIRAIVKQMAAARNNVAPGSLEDAEKQELPAQVGKRLARLIHAEIDRLEHKQARSSGLSLDDLNSMARMQALAERMARSMNRAARSSKQEGKKGRRKPSALDRLALQSGSTETDHASGNGDIEPVTGPGPVVPRHGGTTS